MLALPLPIRLIRLWFLTVADKQLAQTLSMPHLKKKELYYLLTHLYTLIITELWVSK